MKFMKAMAEKISVVPQTSATWTTGVGADGLSFRALIYPWYSLRILLWDRWKWYTVLCFRSEYVDEGMQMCTPQVVGFMIFTNMT
jgi:hypothetical protein